MFPETANWLGSASADKYVYHIYLHRNNFLTTCSITRIIYVGINATI